MNQLPVRACVCVCDIWCIHAQTQTWSLLCKLKYRDQSRHTLTAANRQQNVATQTTPTPTPTPTSTPTPTPTPTSHLHTNTHAHMRGKSHKQPKVKTHLAMNAVSMHVAMSAVSIYERYKYTYCKYICGHERCKYI